MTLSVSRSGTPGRLRLATRRSALALWQARHVQQQLMAQHPGLEVELVPLVSRGDRLLDQPLAKVGGKGLFVKELQQALLEGRADIAVHSVKDVPMHLPEELDVAVICAREDCRDALVSRHFASLDALPPGALVGTSSLRRQCQILERRPDLVVRFLRGNVNTRLAQLDAGHYDAIILAAAGLIRLGMRDRIAQYLDTTVSLPAAGQGAMGIECRRQDQAVLDLIQPLHHETTAWCVQAERAMTRALNGSCQVPIAGLAQITEDDAKGPQLHLRGLVGQPDASVLLRTSQTAAVTETRQLGLAAATDLLAQGAGKILADLALPDDGE